MYERYAYGYDELAPLTLEGLDNQGGIGLMILESLDTLHMMGLTDEFDRYCIRKPWLNAEKICYLGKD